MGRTPLFGADSRLDQDTVTVSVAAATDFPTANLTDDRPYTAYRNGTSVTTLDISTDAGSGNLAMVNYLLIAGHDLFDPSSDGLGACDITFFVSDDNILFVPFGGLSGFVVTSNLLIARTFKAINKRAFKLRIQRAPDFIANIGQVAWGEGVVAPFGMEVNFDPDAERVQARFNRTQVGNFVDSIHHFSDRRATVRMRRVADSFVSGTSVGDFKEFWDNHARLLKPFLFYWNALTDLSTDITDTTHEFQAFFAMIDPASGIQRPLTTQLATDFRDVTFNLVGLAGQ